MHSTVLGSLTSIQTSSREQHKPRSRQLLFPMPEWFQPFLKLNLWDIGCLHLRIFCLVVCFSWQEEEEAAWDPAFGVTLCLQLYPDK